MYPLKEELFLLLLTTLEMKMTAMAGAVGSLESWKSYKYKALKSWLPRPKTNVA
ncbi:hypothetical protein YC2023_033612 [Brassica napus]